jgi:RHS repeat-associated protein
LKKLLFITLLMLSVTVHAAIRKGHFQYDAVNRLTNTISPLGYSTGIAFNHQGLPVLVTDPKGQVTTNTYDGKGRLTSRGDGFGATAYSYDADNNLTNLADSGLTNSWTYDAYDRISSYRDALGNLLQYKYDLNGNLTNLIYPGGRNVYYAYDSNNHLTNVLDWSGRKTSLAYDLDGRLTSLTRPNGTRRTISYDVAGQTTNILEANALGFPLALFEFAWNVNSTAQWEFAAPLPHTNAPPSRTMTYDADNRLLTVNSSSVTVDNNGNLTSGPVTNSVFTNYIYDARNRLFIAGGASSASPTTNFYDGMNNRILQTQGTNLTEYVINPNAKLPQVLMRIKNGVATYYIYGAGLLYQITETPTATNTLTYHYDYRGSTIALSDDNGRVTDRMEYSLYATMTYRVGTNDTPFLFNGRYGVQTDGDGLLYMRARYYSPYLCRFINPDPSGFKGGLNFYAAFGGNPVSYIDPFGLSGQATGDTSTSWNNVGAAHNYYENMSANGLNEGGFAGFTQLLVGQVGEDLIDLSGAGSVQSSAEASGAAAGSGNTEGEIGYGVLAAGGVVLNAIPGEGEVAGKVEGEVVDQLGRDGVDIAEDSAVITPKIEGQLDDRGWDTASINDTILNPEATSPAVNKATGVDATAYFNSDGSYLVRDNSTGEIIQISNRNDPNWIPDSSIVNPYTPQ